MKTPYVLIIGETGNSWAGRASRASLHATRVEAEAELAAYVERNWESEMNEEEKPEDSEDMVEQYFEDVPERYEIAYLIQADLDKQEAR